MALSTYGGLKAALLDWATYSDAATVAAVPDFVSWAHQEIARRLRANFLLSSADVDVSAETVSQPDDFGAVRRFYLDLSPRRRLKTVSPEGAMDLSAGISGCDYPTHVAVEGNDFRLAPLFTGSTTGKLLYYARPADLVADADTNIVMTRYPMLYLFGSLEALFLYKEDDNNADRYGSRFGQLLQSINDSEADDMMAGELQSAPGVRVV